MLLGKLYLFLLDKEWKIFRNFHALTHIESKKEDELGVTLSDKNMSIVHHMKRQKFQDPIIETSISWINKINRQDDTKINVNDVNINLKPIMGNQPNMTYDIMDNQPNMTYDILDNQPNMTYDIMDNQPNMTYDILDNQPNMTYDGISTTNSGDIGEPTNMDSMATPDLGGDTTGDPSPGGGINRPPSLSYDTLDKLTNMSYDITDIQPNMTYDIIDNQQNTTYDGTPTTDTVGTPTPDSGDITEDPTNDNGFSTSTDSGNTGIPTSNLGDIVEVPSTAASRRRKRRRRLRL